MSVRRYVSCRKRIVRYFFKREIRLENTCQFYASNHTQDMYRDHKILTTLALTYHPKKINHLSATSKGENNAIIYKHNIINCIERI